MKKKKRGRDKHTSFSPPLRLPSFSFLLDEFYVIHSSVDLLVELRTNFALPGCRSNTRQPVESNGSGSLLDRFACGIELVDRQLFE